MAVIDKLKLLASRKPPDRPSIAAPPDVASVDEDDLPKPSDINTVFLGGLFLLGMLAACYVAAEIVLPIVLAFVLSLVLHPAMRALELVHLPHGIAAMLIILVLFGTRGGLGAALSGPAASWAQELPADIPKLQERLSVLSRPIAAFQKFGDQAQGLAQGDQPKAVPVAVQGSALSDRLLTGTRSLVSGLLDTVLVLFFLLVSGDTFLRRLVEILPRFKTSDRRSTSRSRSRACIGLPVYHHDHEPGRRRGDRRRHGALRDGRSRVVGNGCLPAQLYSHPGTDDRRRGLPARGPVVHQLAVGGISAGRAIPAHSSRRRRDGDANAARPALDASLMRPRYLIRLFETARRRAVTLGRERIEAADYKAGLEELGWQVLEDFDRELTDVVPDAEELLFELAQLGARTSLSKLRHVIEKKVDDEAATVEAIIDVLIWTGCIGVRTSTQTVYISDCGFKRPFIRALIRNDNDPSIVFHPTLVSIFATPDTAPARSAASRRSRSHQVDARQGSLSV
jgi:hypothetical protein